MESNTQNTEEVIIRCANVIFYSQNDETAYFEWLQRINCIEKKSAWYKELYLHINSCTISDEDLMDLIALFIRYKIKDMKQLRVFLNESNKEWFANPIKVWHKKIFKD